MFLNHLLDKVIVLNGISSKITWNSSNKEVIEWVFKWEILNNLDLSVNWNVYHLVVCHYYSLKHFPWITHWENQKHIRLKTVIPLRLPKIHNSSLCFIWFLKLAHIKWIKFLHYSHIRCFEFLLAFLAHTTEIGFR